MMRVRETAVATEAGAGARAGTRPGAAAAGNDAGSDVGAATVETLALAPDPEPEPEPATGVCVGDNSSEGTVKGNEEPREADEAARDKGDGAGEDGAEPEPLVLRDNESFSGAPALAAPAPKS